MGRHPEQRNRACRGHCCPTNLRESWFQRNWPWACYIAHHSDSIKMPVGSTSAPTGLSKPVRLRLVTFLIAAGILTHSQAQSYGFMVLNASIARDKIYSISRLQDDVINQANRPSVSPETESFSLQRFFQRQHFNSAAKDCPSRFVHGTRLF